MRFLFCRAIPISKISIKIRATHEVMTSRTAQLAFFIVQFMTATRTPSANIRRRIPIRRRARMTTKDTIQNYFPQSHAKREHEAVFNQASTLNNQAENSQGGFIKSVA
jgi:hypothetical protein